MMLRPLIIDDEAKTKAKSIVDYAKEHVYKPFAGDKWVPGDDDNFVGVFNTYRCVFTYTETPDGLYRHLSISVPGSLYPHPASAFTLADLFGFTGWDQKTLLAPEGWMLNANESERCIVLAQKV